jgi:hypothetical protein
MIESYFTQSNQKNKYSGAGGWRLEAGGWRLGFDS